MKRTIPAPARGRMIETVGDVVSDKMQKTRSVSISRQFKHAKYGKIVKRSSVFKAHDENSISKTGDRVRIREGRPLSKTKRWVVVEVLETVKG